MNHKRTFDSWNWNDICRLGLQDQVQPPVAEKRPRPRLLRYLRKL